MNSKHAFDWKEVHTADKKNADIYGSHTTLSWSQTNNNPHKRQQVAQDRIYIDAKEQKRQTSTSDERIPKPHQGASKLCHSRTRGTDSAICMLILQTPATRHREIHSQIHIQAITGPLAWNGQPKYPKNTGKTGRIQLHHRMVKRQSKQNSQNPLQCICISSHGRRADNQHSNPLPSSNSYNGITHTKQWRGIRPPKGAHTKHKQPTQKSTTALFKKIWSDLSIAKNGLILL